MVAPGAAAHSGAGRARAAEDQQLASELASASINQQRVAHHALPGFQTGGVACPAHFTGAEGSAGRWR